MYGKHKLIIGIIFISVGVLSYFFCIDYSWIATEGITVVSIMIAVYMTSFSSIVSSKLGDILQRKVEKNSNCKSQLGILKEYLSFAVLAGIIDIILSCISIILSKETTNIIYQTKFYYLISAIGLATLGVNFFFLLLLFKFMINRQLWNK